MFLAPGNGPRSTSTTSRPARASTRAAAAPAGPAPTTTTSASAMSHHRIATETRRERSHDGRRVSDDGDVGQAHHRATAVEVHADHVGWIAEPAHVLHGPGDPE